MTCVYSRKRSRGLRNDGSRMRHGKDHQQRRELKLAR
jgi:hypothetical protein